MRKGEELQHLIDRIRSEAVDAAEHQAAGILAEAREKAASLVKEGEERAAKFLADAEKAAVAFTERSQRTLEQASRDLLIAVGRGVEAIVAETVSASVGEAMRIEVLEHLMVKMAETYAAREGDGQVTLLISPEDQEKLVHFFAERCRQGWTEGVTVRTDQGVFQGFRVSLLDGRVHHDFSREAIAEAMMNLLRPQLAEIVQRVAREQPASVRGRDS